MKTIQLVLFGFFLVSNAQADCQVQVRGHKSITVESNDKAGAEREAQSRCAGVSSSCSDADVKCAKGGGLIWNCNRWEATSVASKTFPPVSAGSAHRADSQAKKQCKSAGWQGCEVVESSCNPAVDTE